MLPHVLLADDQVTWAPPQQLSSLWNLLRLTMLKRIWIGRCAAVAAGDGPSQASTPAIVCAFIREIRSLMQQDWLRVEGDVRQLGGVCPSWFRGRDPSLPLQRFQSWWCAEDVLASTQLVVGGQPRMVLKLSRFSVPGLPPRKKGLPPTKKKKKVCHFKGSQGFGGLHNSLGVGVNSGSVLSRVL